jgi:hypothetical protein
MLCDYHGLRLIYDESSYQLVYMDVLVLAHLSNFLIKNNLQSFYMMDIRRNYTRHNNIHHNDTRHNNIQ